MTSSLPDPAARAYYDRVNATGRVSIYELMDRSGVSYKTVLSHIRKHKLRGKRVNIGGKPTWTFTERETERYVKMAPRLIDEGVRAGGAFSPEIPAGFLTIEQVAHRRDCTHWFVRDAISGGTLAAVRGKHGKLFVRVEDAIAFEGPKTARGTRLKTIAGLIYFVFDHLNLTDDDIAKIGGVTVRTARGWRISPTPNWVSAGKILAFAGERVNLSLSAELKELSRLHRREYMRDYMAARRKAGAESDRKATDDLYRAAHREERRAAEAERYAKHRRSILARRRDKRREKKKRDLTAGEDQGRNER